MIKIKPHHFLDIIKLYGKGIEKFVPDKNYNHDFYAVANEIIGNHKALIQFTIDGDDICRPCKYIGSDNLCTDKISHIKGIDSKDAWNKILDKRIIDYTKISEDKTYTAEEYCKMLYSIREHIFDVWKEESEDAKKARYDAFCAGAEKYLNIKH